MKAVVMAGGEGTRLRPLSTRLPKPMLPVVNRPMLQRSIEHLKQHGFDEIFVTLAFLPQAVRSYLGDGSEFGVSISYLTEQFPLGTAGSVGQAAGLLDSTFLVTSGDTLCDFDLTSLLRRHRQSGASASLALTKRDDPKEFGLVVTDSAGRVTRFVEKPTWSEVFTDTVNSGVYVLEPEILKYVEPGKPSDFANDVFPQALASQTPIYGFLMEGYWEDIGNLDAYLAAHFDLLDGRMRIQPPGFEVSSGIFLGQDTLIAPSARVIAPCVIGDSCRIGDGAVVGPYAVLGDNSTVGARSLVERSVLHRNVHLRQGVSVRGATLGRNCVVDSGARLELGAVVAEDCSIGADVSIGPEVKIYPSKTVEPGAIVNSSIILESRGWRSLFQNAVVAGLANVDITPELSARVAMAYGSLLPKNSTVVTSRDTSRAARSIKRALMAGLNASGINIVDLELSPLPVTRFQVKAQRAQGGLDVSLDGDREDHVVIRLLDADGVEVDEPTQRKIERLFYREDFRRVPGAEMGEISYPQHALEGYSLNLTSQLDLSVLWGGDLRVVIDYASSSMSTLMPSLLAKLDIDVLALNAFTSTQRVVGFEEVKATQRVGEYVSLSGSHLGVVLHPDSERIYLIDDKGRTLSGHQTLNLFLWLLLKQHEALSFGRASPVVVIPANSSSSTATLAESLGAEVVITKTQPSQLLRAAKAAAARSAVIGGTINHQLLSGGSTGLDSPAALLHLLASYARIRTQTAEPLSQIVNALPNPTVLRESIAVPPSLVGGIMRSLATKQGAHQLVEGVRITTTQSTVLVTPSAIEGLLDLYVESSQSEAANLGTSRVEASLDQSLLDTRSQIEDLVEAHRSDTAPVDQLR